MKTKKVTVPALILALVLIAGVTTAFATSPAKPPEEPQGVVAEGTLLSYVDPEDGKTYYSLDDGKSFEAMTDEEFQRRFPGTGTDVEWWTYEEYAAWLENEKIELQSMLGERGWTGGRGEFIWTQEIIDETITLYEKILQEIKAGALYSKSVDGDTDSMLISGGDFMPELAPYAEFGLSYTADLATGYIMHWQGKQVHSLYDTESGSWFAANLHGSNLESDAIDLETVYENGKLTGLKESRAWCTADHGAQAGLAD